MKKYLLGFVLSILLTLVAFGLVWMHVASGHVSPTHEFLGAALPILALLQLGVQLYFFLHVKESGGWNKAALAFAGIIVVFIVGGTLWIMSNLSHMNADGMFMDGHITPQSELD